MSDLYKLNFPVETEEAKRFWASRHKSNRLKAMAAFSLNKPNYNDNMRRAGYSLWWRRKAILSYSQYIRDPGMKDVPFSTLSEPFWLWQ